MSSLEVAMCTYMVETLGIPSNSPTHVTVSGAGDEKDAVRCAVNLDNRFSKHSFRPTGYAISINRAPPRVMTIKELLLDHYLYGD
jgi:hypothetical protein